MPWLERPGIAAVLVDAPMCHTFATEVSLGAWTYLPGHLDLSDIEPMRGKQGTPCSQQPEVTEEPIP